jgi:hypothetical protein
MNFRQVSRYTGYTGWNGGALTHHWHLRMATAFVNGAKAGELEY